MKRTIDVFELAREGGRVEADLALSDLPRLASMLADAQGRLACRLHGRIDEQGRDAAALELRARLRLICDRCGGVLEWPIDSSAGFFFVPDPAELEALPISVEGDEPLLGSRRFDWLELAEDQAILSLPISPRHESCAAPPLERPDDAGEPHPFAALDLLKKGRTVVK